MPRLTEVDHVVLTVTDLDVSTKFYDEVMGHLNFRDPDNIALEITASSEAYAAALQRLPDSEMSDDEIRAYAAQLMGAEM